MKHIKAERRRQAAGEAVLQQAVIVTEINKGNDQGKRSRIMIVTVKRNGQGNRNGNRSNNVVTIYFQGKLRNDQRSK